MRRRDSNPAEASTLAASAGEPPKGPPAWSPFGLPQPPGDVRQAYHATGYNEASASATTRRDRHGYGAWHGGP